MYLDDFCAFVLGDVAVLVNVVHLEGPAQTIFRPAPRRHAQSHHELSKVEPVVVVLVERAENVLRELGGVAVGKMLNVDVFELVDGEGALREVLQKVFVPLANFRLAELGVLLKVADGLGAQLAGGATASHIGGGGGHSGC